MRAVVARGLGMGWVVQDVPEPSIAPDEILLAVEASGVCHTDFRLETRADYGGTFPRVPGHEFVGRVVEVGSEVRGWRTGERAGVAWPQRWCGHCRMCLEQSYSFCSSGCAVTGGTVDGGHAEFAAVQADAAIPLPLEVPASELAPVLCAGYTAYSALSDAGVGPGDRVAVIGVGGLGHLAIQYARALGAAVVAVTRDADKREELLAFGAAEVIISPADRAGEALDRAGGADVIVLSGIAAAGSIADGARAGARIAFLSPEDAPLAISARELIFKRLRVIGSSPGSRELLRQAVALHAAQAVRVATEVVPLEEAARALERVSRGAARYRAVLVPERVVGAHFD